MGGRSGVSVPAGGDYSLGSQRRSLLCLIYDPYSAA